MALLVSPAFQLRWSTMLAFSLRCCYDNGFSAALLWRFLSLLHGACFEQGQKKRRVEPLMALRSTSATLTPYVSRSYCDPWRFSAIWTNFAIVVEAPASEMGGFTDNWGPIFIATKWVQNETSITHTSKLPFAAQNLMKPMTQNLGPW